MCHYPRTSSVLPLSSFLSSSHGWHQALQASAPPELSLCCAASGGRITNPHQATCLLRYWHLAPEATARPLLCCWDTNLPFANLLSFFSLVTHQSWPCQPGGGFRASIPFQDPSSLCCLLLGSGIPVILHRPPPDQFKCLLHSLRT